MSLKSRNFYWGVVDSQFKAHLAAFIRAHNRVRDGKAPSIEWARTLEGFVAFLKEVGPIPTGMQKPSLGRKFHNRGYETGNIQWEEHKFNSVKRKGTKFEHSTKTVVELRVFAFKKGSPEHKAHQANASKKRWEKEGQREMMSARMIGNKHWKGKSK